jgi:hypothetical protein
MTDFTQLVSMFAAIASTFAAASASASDITQVPQFSVDEIAWSKGLGPNNIDGKAARDDDADTATCAGEDVVLRPSSALERHRNRIIFGNIEGARIPAQRYLNPPGATATTMPSPPKDYDAAARKATCSIDGKFLFSGVPDGEYYALTMLFPRALLGKVVPIENVEVIMKRVRVTGGETAKLDLFARP